MAETKLLNWDRIYKQSISSNITVEQFISRIKDSPWEIYKFDIRYCIEKLRDESIHSTQRKSKKAREILRKAGLNAFISKDASKRKTENTKLRSWENSPFSLFQEVENLKFIMRPHWKRLSKKTSRDDRNRRAIEALLKKGEELDEDRFEIITEGERDKDITHLAISILSEQNNINFEKLKSYYYKNTHYIDEETKQKKSYKRKLKPITKEDLKVKTNNIIPFGLSGLDILGLLHMQDQDFPDQTYPEFVYEHTFKLYSIQNRVLEKSI